MRMRTLGRFALLGGGLALILAFPTLRSSSPALAQSGGPYDLSWSTIDGGGGTSSGGDYALSGTVGQYDAGAMSGGGYTLSGGFWAGTSRIYRHYLPLVSRGS